MTVDLTGAPQRATDQPDEIQTLLRFWKEKQELAERGCADYRSRWSGYYGLYRNYSRLRRALNTEPDRDLRAGLLLDSRREFGEELFIPYCFTVVETVLPRALSNDPRMLVPPKTEDAAEAAKRVQRAFDVMQKEISYEMKLQSVARSGFKYGLGVMKTYWESETRKVMQNQPSRNPLRRNKFQAVETEVLVREGPQAEPVDIWDFFWDPLATSIETCNWIIHRTWRATSYVKDRVESEQWLPIDLQAAEARASNKRMDTIKDRRDAAGLPNLDSAAEGKYHEVWECHDGERVVTVLDREMVVQNEVTPFFHRELPFQIFRPTPQEHEFVGIGEIEPIVGLQYELNATRSMRLDNAALLIQKAFLYAEGFVDPDDLKIGPGFGIPVKGTDINSVIKPLEFGDIPASGYQEVQEIKEDIERVTGVSDAAAGGGGGGTPGTETATGIQIVQAALNVRTRIKTKNLMVETIRPAARQWLELNRQHRFVDMPVRVPDGQDGYTFDTVTPDDWNAELDDPVPDAGSTEPDNPAARQNAALTLYNALSVNPGVDVRKLATHMLREFDVADAESFLAPLNGVPVDPKVLGETLAQLGIPEDIVVQAVQQALQAATVQQGQGPDQGPGVEGPPPQQGAPPNG